MFGQVVIVARGASVGLDEEFGRLSLHVIDLLQRLFDYVIICRLVTEVQRCVSELMKVSLNFGRALS